MTNTKRKEQLQQIRQRTQLSQPVWFLDKRYVAPHGKDRGGWGFTQTHPLQSIFAAMDSLGPEGGVIYHVGGSVPEYLFDTAPYQR